MITVIKHEKGHVHMICTCFFISVWTVQCTNFLLLSNYYEGWLEFCMRWWADSHFCSLHLDCKWVITRYHFLQWKISQDPVGPLKAPKLVVDHWCTMDSVIWLTAPCPTLTICFPFPQVRLVGQNQFSFLISCCFHLIIRVSCTEWIYMLLIRHSSWCIMN